MNASQPVIHKQCMAMAAHSTGSPHCLHTTGDVLAARAPDAGPPARCHSCRPQPLHRNKLAAALAVYIAAHMLPAGGQHAAGTSYRAKACGMQQRHQKPGASPASIYLVHAQKVHAAAHKCCLVHTQAPRRSITGAALAPSGPKQCLLGCAHKVMCSRGTDTAAAAASSRPAQEAQQGLVCCCWWSLLRRAHPCCSISSCVQANLLQAWRRMPEDASAWKTHQLLLQDSFFTSVALCFAM